MEPFMTTFTRMVPFENLISSLLELSYLAIRHSSDHLSDAVGSANHLYPGHVRNTQHIYPVYLFVPNSGHSGMGVSHPGDLRIIGDRQPDDRKIPISC